MAMKLEMLLAALPEAAVRGNPAREIAGLACDSRQVRPGDLFIAVPGRACDGAAFATDAVAKGAAAVVSAAPLPGIRTVPVIRVADARAALARLAIVFHGDPGARLRLVGVTGTNGKTTVSYLLRDLLETAEAPCGLIGTVEYRLGNRIIPASRTTPDALTLQSYLAQMAHAGCASAVMEVSSHALDQGRVWGVDFDAAVFTNLTQDHLDYHGTLEAYFAAKRTLFAGLGSGGKAAVAVLNVDDPYGRRLREAIRPGVRVVTVGRAPDAEVRAERITAVPGGTRFSVATPWGAAEASLRLLGDFNVANALAALATGAALGRPLSQVLQRLAECRGAPGRLEAVPTRRAFQVFVDYAHTDDALANVLRAVRERTAGRVIVVFGCGGNRDTAKRPKMGAAAARLADFSVLTSDNPRTEDPMAILAQIEAGMGAAPREVVADRREAIGRALAMAGAGDVVLIAGKGHESFQDFGNRVVPFDDRMVARELLS